MAGKSNNAVQSSGNQAIDAVRQWTCPISVNQELERPVTVLCSEVVQNRLPITPFLAS